MVTFIKSEAPVDGVQIITPKQLGECREWLCDIDAEEYNVLAQEVLMPEDDGECGEFVQMSIDLYGRGEMKGLHFQRRDAQGRLVGISEGRVLSVAVDLRPDSKEYGAAYAIEQSAQNEVLLYIPPYFAYGFLTLEKDTEVVINTTTPYDPDSQAGIIWDDEILAINWQMERYEIDEKWLKISQNDKKLPSFRSYNPNSLWLNRPVKKRRFAK